MTEDPIVQDVHRIREEMLAEHGGDLNALVKNLQRLTKESAALGRRVVAMPPRTAQQSTPKKKVG